jgi:predicted transcriptional regulator
MSPATDPNTSIPADDPRDRLSVVHVAGKIVAAYVSKNEVSTSDLPGLITATIDAIEGRLRSHVEGSDPHRPTSDASKTVFPDHLVSLEDGRSYKTLKRHLRKYGLSPDDYRRKWNLPSDYPMVAENYSKARSQLAKDTGLGFARPLKAVA